MSKLEKNETIGTSPQDLDEGEDYHLTICFKSIFIFIQSSKGGFDFTV